MSLPANVSAMSPADPGVPSAGDLAPRVSALELAVAQLRWFVPVAVALGSFGADALQSTAPELVGPAGLGALGLLGVTLLGGRRLA